MSGRPSVLARGGGGSLARQLAWLALAAQAAFAAAWVVAGALDEGYSHIEQGVSELGAGDAANPWIVNTGIVLLGVAVAALAPALTRVLPGRRATWVAAALFVTAGSALALGGVFPLDCGMSQERCEASWRAGELSWQHEVHLWVGLAFDAAFVLTPFALARALWPRPSGLLALSSGVTGIVILLVFTGLFQSEAAASGLVQRVGLGVVHLWVLIVAVGILHSTRTEPDPSELSPLRPREFFDGAWSGEGELVPWPRLLWRRFPLRFRATRTFTWLTDEAWLMDDEATFEGGRVERRRRFFHLVAPDRIHATADDVPDGADLLLEEGGYRITPYRFVVPIGPLRFRLRCREQHRLEDDGTVVDTMRLSWLGLPVAWITIRARAGRGDG